ncbi:MAG: hypothetical protein HKM95_11750, partial [Inquilinus sp.]|nr:hypothetical protein [Inquilinus sp.]
SRSWTAMEVAARLPAPRVVRGVFGNTAAAAVRQAVVEHQQFEDEDPASETDRLLSAGMARIREAQRRP